CLRCYAIVLVVLLILAAILRVATGGLPHLLSEHIMTQGPGAVRTTQTLPDGTKVIRVVNAGKHESVELRVAPDGNTTQIIHDPSSRSSRSSQEHDTNLNFGIFGVSEHQNLGGDTTILKIGTLPLELLFAISLFGAMIVATVLAGALTKENEGHLELAWTKPVSRETYALVLMGVDIAGILAAIVLGIVYQLIETSFWLVPHIKLTSNTAELVGFAILLPIAWYVLLTACAASLKRMLGMVSGMAWPLAAFLLIFATINFGNAPAATALNLAFRTVDTINPLAYFAQIFSQGRVTLVPPGLASGIIALAVITIVSTAAAVLQWRRVEA
ncbi:MAG: hypothetical protein ABI182_02685, partial [Candidatus Baltobacteraceae bacterium]